MSQYLTAPPKSHRNTYHAGGGSYLQEDPSVEPDLFTQIPGNGNYRGAYIASYAQMKLLRDKYGIKTIVNLARDSMRQDRGRQKDEELGCGSSSTPCEPLWVAKAGLAYIYVPVTANHPPSASNWNLIREALLDGHVYVHCTHGVDRDWRGDGAVETGTGGGFLTTRPCHTLMLSEGRGSAPATRMRRFGDGFFRASMIPTFSPS